MNVYLNVIEMGPGIFGIEAASRQYFNKSAQNLSRQEAALIAAVLPNPRRFSAAKPSAYTQKRQAWVLRQMSFWGGKLNYDESPNEKEPRKKEKRKN